MVLSLSAGALNRVAIEDHFEWSLPSSLGPKLDLKGGLCAHSKVVKVLIAVNFSVFRDLAKWITSR